MLSYAANGHIPQGYSGAIRRPPKGISSGEYMKRELHDGLHTTAGNASHEFQLSHPF
jgi:hypothetical protein